MTNADEIKAKEMQDDADAAKMKEERLLELKKEEEVKDADIEKIKEEEAKLAS